jgi:hypothetical protein
MRKMLTLLTAAALIGMTAIASAQDSSSVLQMLPTKVQKAIEEVRASCREHGVLDRSIYDDSGLTRFTLTGAADAVMVNDGDICGGERIKAANCHTGGCDVTVYVRSGNTWRKALSGRGDTFLSLDYSRDPPAFKAAVLTLYGDSRDCPIRDANMRAYGPTAWKHGQCDVIAKWDGTRFILRLLDTVR